MISEIDIIRAAHDRIGAEPPDDLNAELQGGVTAKMAYDLEVRMALALYPWSFAQRLYRLAQLSGEPIAGYRRKFQLPVEDIIIGADRIIDDPTLEDDNFTDFKRFGDEVYSNAFDLYAVMRVEVGPHLWNPLFTRAVISGLAGVLYEAIAADGKNADRLIREAYGSPQEEKRGGLIRAAINADAYTRPNRRLRMGNNPLLTSYLS